MAAEEKSATGAPAKKKSPLPMIIIGILVLAAGGGAAWKFMKPKAAAPGKPAAESPSARAAAIYYKFDPAFVVNFRQRRQHALPADHARGDEPRSGGGR